MYINAYKLLKISRAPHVDVSAHAVWKLHLPLFDFHSWFFPPLWIHLLLILLPSAPFQIPTPCLFSLPVILVELDFCCQKFSMAPKAALHLLQHCYSFFSLHCMWGSDWKCRECFITDDGNQITPHTHAHKHSIVTITLTFPCSVSTRLKQSQLHLEVNIFLSVVACPRHSASVSSQRKTENFKPGEILIFILVC